MILQGKAQKLQGEIQRGFGGFGKPKPTFTLLNGELSGLSETAGQADQAPTDAMHVAYHDYCQDLTKVTQQWSELDEAGLAGGEHAAHAAETSAADTGDGKRKCACMRMSALVVST